MTPTTTSETTAPTDDRRAVTTYAALVRIVRSLRCEGGSGALSLGSTSALWVIAQCGPMRLSDLAHREGVSAPTMSRIVSGLERDGMVRRTTDPDDRRASLLEPTEQGRELVTGTTSRRSQIMHEALTRLTPADRDAAERSIELLAAAITDRSRRPA